MTLKVKVDLVNTHPHTFNGVTSISVQTQTIYPNYPEGELVIIQYGSHVTRLKPDEWVSVLSMEKEM